MIKITTNMYENPLLPKIHQLYFLSKNFLEKCGLILFPVRLLFYQKMLRFTSFFVIIYSDFTASFSFVGKKAGLTQFF